MASIELSRLAAHDLEGIEIYTKQTWSAQQAIRYVGQIERSISELAKGIAIGRSAGLPNPHLMKERSGRHFVIFLRTPELVFVSRVLHAAMNFQRDEFPVILNEATQ